MTILDIYNRLLDEYGPQGWWPLLELDNREDIKITKSGSTSGYHPRDYSYPKTDRQRFEIIVGAILTQNTSWLQVEKALKNLEKVGCLSAEKIIEMAIEILKDAIRPAGYFNQKSERLKIISDWFADLGKRIPTRDELLSIKGVGPETTDSILLYAFGVPSFVVDAYTKRIFGHLGLIDDGWSYDKIKGEFESNLPKDMIVYQEYHALIVEHAKRYYSKKPYCPLVSLLK